MKEMTIGRNDAGQRLDKFLLKALPTLPPPLLYKAIRTKKIKLNRARTDGGAILREGDILLLFLAPEFFAERAAEENFMRLTPRVRVVYEDGNVILCDKPEGVLCHSDENESGDTLIDHVKAYLFRKGEYNPSSEQSFAPALCNRIDRNTGGIVIAAKNAAALRELNAAIKGGRVHKKYLCAVKGAPKSEDLLHGFIVKDSGSNEVRVFDERPKNPALSRTAKEYFTRYRLIERKGNVSLLEVELLTGRTHQIRASLAHVGLPLLGDGKYGVNRDEKKNGFPHQALYSYKLEFDFPPESPLRYLNERVFEVDKDNIRFLREF